MTASDFFRLSLIVVTILISAGAVHLAAIVVSARVEVSAVVINEIDYDQPGADTAEFIEIKNGSEICINLDDYSLELINGIGGSEMPYRLYELPDFELAPGDYYVLCGDPANVANCDLDLQPDSNLILNGAPAAVALLFKDTMIDTVSYEGDVEAPYAEGSGSGLEDNPALGNMGISRCPDGTDTDQNNIDFSYQSITPGSANACWLPELKIYLFLPSAFSDYVLR